MPSPKIGRKEGARETGDNDSKKCSWVRAVDMVRNPVINNFEITVVE